MRAVRVRFRSFRCVWYICRWKEADASILISVSKRRFKRAVKRNRVKRQIRESYRINKHELLNVLAERKCRLAVAFIYLSDQLVESSIIEDRMRIALARITEKMAAPDTDAPSTALEP